MHESRASRMQASGDKARRRLNRSALLIATLAAALVLGGCSPLRGVEAGLVLDDIAAGPKPSLYKDLTDEPARSAIHYAIDGQAFDGDLYRPADDADAALVLVPGVAPAGKDDPRLVAFARTLARAGFVVLVPDLPRLRALEVDSTDIADIADAVHYLADVVGPASDTPVVGLVAFSYAVGPSVIAVLRRGIRDRVRFVLGIGGYFDMTAVITYVTTGAFRPGPDDPWQYGRPNDYGKWVFLRSNADRVGDRRDRALLAAIAGRKLAAPKADISNLVARLGPEGRKVYALLANRDPDRTQALIAELPSPIRDEIAALDPSRYDFRRLRARLILVHGRDDPIIPYTQSEELAAAAPKGRATLYVVDDLAHVDLQPPDLDDIVALWQAVYDILEERDDMPAPKNLPPDSGR